MLVSPNMTATPLIAGLLIALATQSANADDNPVSNESQDYIELAQAGSIAAPVATRGDYTVVKIDDEIQVALPTSRVSRVVRHADMRSYEQAVSQAGLDAEANQQLAALCAQPGNVPGRSSVHRIFHYRRAMAADPDNSVARASLGYRQENGRWVKVDELMRERGMVLHGGWEMQERVVADEQAEANEIASKRWVPDLIRLIKMASQSGSKAAEAAAELDAIDDPLSTFAWVKTFNRSDSDRNLRMLALKKMATFRNGLATQTLVKSGLDDNDAVVREAALEALTQYPFGRSSAVATYLPMLKSDDNGLVNRAATALAWFPDPELDLVYADALITTRKTVTQPGAGMNVGFGSSSGGGGGGGLSTGGKATVQETPVNNPAVLALLRTIEPEANFGYDEAAWRRYFVEKRTASPGNLFEDF